MQGFQQDWEPVRIQRFTASGKPAVAGGNRATAPMARQNPDAAHLRKLDAADTPVKPKRLTAQSRQEIVTRRTTAGWNQTQLNQQCLFPVNTIREIEAGRLTPTTQQLNTLNRVLKTGLKLEQQP